MSDPSYNLIGKKDVLKVYVRKLEHCERSVGRDWEVGERWFLL